MRILVTSSRFPHALGVIRKFGEQGHEIYTTDTYAETPGSHSKYVKEAFITAEPASQALAFVADIARIVREKSIELVIPCFEEVFPLVKHRSELGDKTELFCSTLDNLTTLHDKGKFVEFARSIDIPVPATTLVRSRDELRDVCAKKPGYIGRPVFSRGGVRLYTDTGPLAGVAPIEKCNPTEAYPWIVQEFIHGTEVCSFSVAKHGKLVAHDTYVHPMTINHAGGIAFESVDEPEAVAITKKIVEAMNYHGHISLDFIKTEDGKLHVLECNPRPTAGIFMMNTSDYVDAVLNEPRATTLVSAPGTKAQIGVAIVRDMFRNPKSIPEDLAWLFSGVEDIYAAKGDAMPLLYAFLSYSHVVAYRNRLNLERHSTSDLVASQFFDVAWNGDPIP